MSAKPRRLGLSGQIVVALVIGIACGLFFGEYTGWMRTVGDVFVRLLQMTVLPYIVVSLITGLGKLEPGTGARLLGRAVVVLLGLWIIGLAVFFLYPLALPTTENASFFSSSLVETPPSVDFVALFIPENVFDSLARYTIPAVVLFCLFLGGALMTMPPEQKNALLAPLDALREALGRVNFFIVKLTPFGVFAITASLAGTMTIEEFGRIQGYLLIHTVSCLLLAFVILPNVVAAFTPFSARQVLRASRDAMIMAFATGKLLVVLPLLVEKTHELFEQAGADSEQAGGAVDLLYPVAYPLPNLGKLAALTFLPFAAWFAGRSLLPEDYAALAGTGVVSSFGGPLITVSFLLGLLRLPGDMMQLFLAPGVFTSRINDMLGAIHLMTLVLIAGSWSLSILRFRLRALLMTLVVAAGVFLVTMLGIRAWLASSTAEYDKDQVLQAMTGYQDPRIPADIDIAVTTEPAAHPVALQAGQTRIERIRASGALRVGYRTEIYPFSFVNSAGDLVGFEIDLARRLAADLGVRLELIRAETDTVAEQIENDHFDIAMAGLPATPATASRLQLSVPYMEAHLALVVRDHRAREFSTMRALDQPGTTLAMPNEGYFRSRVEQAFPNLELRILSNPRDFFEAGEDEFDAMLSSAEGGSAWTLLYPDFQVVQPTEGSASIPVVHAMHPEAADLYRVVNAWIALQKTNGYVDALYDHWILGKDAGPKQPRWSVIRDVLGWVR